MTKTMCGITGFLESGPTEQRTEVLRRMTRSLRHRGPDDEGFHVDAFAALGARRLSVIDLQHGHQPMAGGRDTVVVTRVKVGDADATLVSLQRICARSFWW
jgi:asparagine synthase (glutamine-hydrolysing)